MNSQGFIELDKLVVLKYISPSLDSKLLKIDCPQSIECRLTGGRPRVRRREGWEKWVLDPALRDTLITEEPEPATTQLAELSRKPPGAPISSERSWATVASASTLPLSSSSRCKVYRLKDKDCLGVGFCSTLKNDAGDGVVLEVKSETDLTAIISTKVAGKQFQVQDDTMIVWTETDGTDMALNFQDGAGRDAVWPWLRVRENLAPYPANEISDEEYTTIKCHCGVSADDGNTVLCETCDTWQHIICYYGSAQQVPDVHECVDCDPRTLARTGAAEKQQEQLERQQAMDIVPGSPRKPVYHTRTGRLSRAKRGLQVHCCACGKIYTRAEHLKRHQRTCDRRDMHTPDDRVERLQKNDPRVSGLYPSKNEFDSGLMGDGAPSKESITSLVEYIDDFWSTQAQSEYAGSKLHGLDIRTQDGMQQAEPSTNDGFHQFEDTEFSISNSMSSSRPTEGAVEEDPIVAARTHPFYNQMPDQSGHYYCPEQGRLLCSHKPTTLKDKYDTYVDSHIRPYRCNREPCVDLGHSSAACLLRHEREAHGMHGHGARPHLCHFKDCERSIPGQGFPRRYSLFDHMKRVHQYEGPTTTPSSSDLPRQATRGFSETTLALPAYPNDQDSTNTQAGDRLKLPDLPDLLKHDSIASRPDNKGARLADGHLPIIQDRVAKGVGQGAEDPVRIQQADRSSIRTPQMIMNARRQRRESEEQRKSEKESSGRTAETAQATDTIGVFSTSDPMKPNLSRSATANTSRKRGRAPEAQHTDTSPDISEIGTGSADQPGSTIDDMTYLQPRHTHEEPMSIQDPTGSAALVQSNNNPSNVNEAASFGHTLPNLDLENLASENVDSQNLDWEKFDIEPRWEFEKILDCHKNQNGLNYQIAWRHHKPTWQLAKDLKDNVEAVREFHTANPTKPDPPDWARLLPPVESVKPEYSRNHNASRPQSLASVIRPSPGSWHPSSLSNTHPSTYPNNPRGFNASEPQFSLDLPSFPNPPPHGTDTWSQPSSRAASVVEPHQHPNLLPRPMLESLQAQTPPPPPLPPPRSIAQHPTLPGNFRPPLPPMTMGQHSSPPGGVYTSSASPDATGTKDGYEAEETTGAKTSSPSHCLTQISREGAHPSTPPVTWTKPFINAADLVKSHYPPEHPPVSPFNPTSPLSISAPRLPPDTATLNPRSLWSDDYQTQEAANIDAMIQQSDALIQQSDALFRPPQPDPEATMRQREVYRADWEEELRKQAAIEIDIETEPPLAQNPSSARLMRRRRRSVDFVDADGDIQTSQHGNDHRKATASPTEDFILFDTKGSRRRRRNNDDPKPDYTRETGELC